MEGGLWNAPCPVRINLQNGTTEQLHEIDNTIRTLIPSGSYPPEGEVKALPCGSYEGMVIWEWYLCTDRGMEPVYFLFCEEKFAGALHIQDSSQWEVYDKNGNRIPQKVPKEFSKAAKGFYFPVK